MPDDVQLVRLRPHTAMEYDGSVESGVVETDVVACASRLRSPSFMLALHSFTDLFRKRVIRRFVDRLGMSPNISLQGFSCC